MGTIWQDLQYGWRMLRRSPGFSLVAILTLAIGIGANAAMFSVINTVLLRPLPFPDAQRIVFIWKTDPNRNIPRGVASAAEFLDWRDQNHSFEELSRLAHLVLQPYRHQRTRAGLRRPRFSKFPSPARRQARSSAATSSPKKIRSATIRWRMLHCRSMATPLQQRHCRCIGGKIL